MNTNSLPLEQHNNMVKSYEIALAANTVFDLRNEKTIEKAKVIADLLAHNADPMRAHVADVLELAARIDDEHTKAFNRLVGAAAVLMPARHVFDANNIEFSTKSRYSGPPHL